MRSRGFDLETIDLYKRKDKFLYYKLVQHCYDVRSREIAEQRLYNLIDTAVSIGACISKEGNKSFKKHYKNIVKYINSISEDKINVFEEGIDVQTFAKQTGLMGVSSKVNGS